MEYGGNLDEEIMKERNVPYIAIIFAAINIAIFFVTEWMGETTDAEFMVKMGANTPVDSIQRGEYWRWLTSMFLHFGFQHLLNNMVALLAVAYSLECELGHWKYTVIYIIAGLGGSIVSTCENLYTGTMVVSAGASGAIFGTFGALLCVVIRNKGKYEGMTLKGVLFMLAMFIYYGISTASIDNGAHIGGLVIGLILCFILYRKKKTDN